MPREDVQRPLPQAGLHRLGDWVLGQSQRGRVTVGGPRAGAIGKALLAGLFLRSPRRGRTQTSLRAWASLPQVDGLIILSARALTRGASR